MKINNKSGFVLAETIVISVVVLVALVGIYMQFSYLTKAFYQSFQYNGVNNLYLTNNIKKFLMSDNLIGLKNKVNSSDYVDISNCDATLFNEYSYCKTLFDSVGAKRVIITQKNLDNLKSNLNTTDFNEYLKKFINSLNTKEVEGYRLIVEYEDNQFVSIDLR